MQSGKIYGYARVSSKHQNEERQLIALRAFGIRDRDIYCDRQSGKDFDRPNYQRLLLRLQAGDVFVVKSIDRLGRNYNEILYQWRLLTKEKQVFIVVLDMPLLEDVYKRQPSQGLTPRCKKIIELSLTEAARLGHHYVGTEHLLLGILREGDGVAVRVLSGTGVEPRRLHADVVAAMGGEA